MADILPQYSRTPRSERRTPAMLDPIAEGEARFLILDRRGLNGRDQGVGTNGHPMLASKEPQVFEAPACTSCLITKVLVGPDRRSTKPRLGQHEEALRRDAYPSTKAESSRTSSSPCT